MQPSQPGSWEQLPPDVLARIASMLDCNEVAATFRGINKVAAVQFNDPKHTTVRLSQPVPPEAFATKWLAPGATRALTLKQRRQLLCLTAASGLVANLEVALQAVGCPLTYQVFEAAAAAGKLESCQWLWERDCPKSPKGEYASGFLAAAAGAGHQHVCEWLLSLDLFWASDGAAEAAHGGHVGLMEWLQERRPPMCLFDMDVTRLPKCAAYGCNLATLQRLWAGRGSVATQDRKSAVLAEAVASPTSDWAAKVEWLEAQGCPLDGWMAQQAAACPDAPARLAWLRGRGFPLGQIAVSGAAEAGNLAALQYLLAEGTVSPQEISERSVTTLAGRGHLTALQAVHAAAGIWPDQLVRDAGLAAARAGNRHVLSWLVDTCGQNAVALDAELFMAAAESGSVELLAWLRERGCPWHQPGDPGPYTRAARSGCEAALEWLAERGCPMPDTGEPYLAAACLNGDLPTLRCLRRLGVPWGPAGMVLNLAARDAPLPIFYWLRDESGAPNVAAAVDALEID
ncbi:hypothetical protein GPECTOR_26g611 [Gonium pectorale]|uniref:Uncharacterized protein n=1 Tax=Gonium pectorale TaxID=33097 RepID=A0A150GFU2_GONPE|nr:hypothetical protein GPECTOR_26g611 [Gonium pectorale]|eukprot:KXZ48708.1 hypothetical protein GPECTOR_26g611 [Gonium pectorale]